jgi:hypothetical protein
MTMLFALLLQAATVPGATPPPSGAAPRATPAPPADWNALPDLPLQRRWLGGPRLSDYVRDEVRAGRCATVDGATTGLSVDIAVLLAADGTTRRIVPRAIGCPTVEQYASGVALRMMRDNIAAPGADRWFRTTIAFAWP